MLKYLLLFCSIFASCFSYQYELSVCTIFRDEAPYLKEWLEFHRMLGVDHFYLCNHNSNDNFLEVLEPYIKSGIVELKDSIDLEQENRYFTEIVNASRGVSKWVTFLDIDEFFCLVNRDSLVEFLKDYEEFGGVCANWQIFRNSSVENFDSKRLVIEQFVYCGPADHPNNFHVNIIAQPEKILEFSNPHYATYLPGYYQVNTNKEQVVGPWCSIIIDKLRINRYSSDEDFEEEDFTIQRFVPALRKRMGLD